MSQLFIFPIVLLFSIAGTAGVALNRPVIWARDGMLIVQAGSQTYTHALADCEWFYGHASQMTLLQNVLLPREPAIVLALPREPGEQEKLAVTGFTDESRQRWASFLTVAGVLRRTAWEKRPSVLRQVANVLAAILILPVSFVGCALLGVLTRYLLLTLRVDVDIANVLGFLVFVPGTIYAIGYLAILWPWKAIPLAPSRRSSDEKRKMRWKLVGALLLKSAVMIALPLLIYPMFPLHARIVGAITVMAATWFLGNDLAKRASELEWARTEKEACEAGA